MPQLDKFAFAPQVFWLVLIFFALYLLLLRNGLTTLYKILTFRKRLIVELGRTSHLLSQEITLGKLLFSKFLNSFVYSRGVIESFFKIVDFLLIASFKQQLHIFNNRLTFGGIDLTFSYLAKHQFVAPALANFSSIKI